MVNHGHFLLNGRKHNIPSYFVTVGDKIEIKEKLKNSPLYSQNTSENKGKTPSRIKLDKASNTIEVIGLPQV
jgi:small subunit ribosomal protein S4